VSNNPTATLTRWTLGASRVKRLMLGDLPYLWGVITNRRDEEEPSPQFALHIAMGEALEPLHTAWFRKETGVAVRLQQYHCPHLTLPLHATLDGVVDMPVRMLGMPGDETRILPWEGKTCRPGLKPADLIAREHHQLQAQMMCMGTTLAVVSILWRTPKWGAFVVESCTEAQQEIEERLSILAHHVARDTPPPDLGEAFTPEPRFAPLILSKED
jgi:hypothetical protein